MFWYRLMSSSRRLTDTTFKYAPMSPANVNSKEHVISLLHFLWHTFSNTFIETSNIGASKTSFIIFPLQCFKTMEEHSSVPIFCISFITCKCESHPTFVHRPECIMSLNSQTIPCVSICKGLYKLGSSPLELDQLKASSSSTYILNQIHLFGFQSKARKTILHFL